MAISYLHPYIESNIYDNSEVFESSAGGTTVLFQPYFSERGVSNILEEYTDLATFIKEKGYPNYRKYGQSMYNIISWLKGGGKVVGIRLTADNATYANVGLNVKTKAVTEQVPKLGPDGSPLPSGETEEVKKIKVKLETVTIPSLQSNKKDDIDLVVKQNEEQVDSEGYTNHIVFLLASRGKGGYGNDISIRLSQDKTSDKTYNFKAYNLTVVQRKNNGTISSTEGPLPVSLYPDAMSLGGSSLLISQMITEYFESISCYYNEESYDKLIDDIMTGTDNYYDNIGTIDFIFGDNKRIDVDQDGAKSLFSYAGCFCEEGSDGNLFIPKTQSPSEQEKLLLKLFNGTTTTEIYDRKQFPFDVILDFNTSAAVKMAMNDFVQQRGDCVLMLDTCQQASAAATVNWKKANLVLDDYLTSIWSQMFVVYDQYTAQDVYVTPTYFLASKIPDNDNKYGVQNTFVGPNRGILTNFKKLNWSPNEDQKENLYDARINYIEQNYRNTRFMSQLTAQSKTTSLSDINHVRVLLRIVRSVEEAMESYIFEMATDSTINRINSTLENLLNPWVANGTCTLCTGTCSQTIIEKEQKIAHVTINIVFVDVIERIVIDINVGR